jgi:uncharacterized MAPEG superfamily protein
MPINGRYWTLARLFGSEVPMITDIQALVYSSALTFVMLLSASMLRSKGWTREGMKIAVGNRDAVVEASALAGRADRAAKNMLEAMGMFIAVVAAARFAGRGSEAALGATVFFWARVVYWAVYLAGVPYVRTAVWFVGVAGIVMVGRAAL